jgi:hypothetical protein
MSPLFAVCPMLTKRGGPHWPTLVLPDPSVTVGTLQRFAIDAKLAAQ